MAKGVVWNGLDEYLAELRRLPEDCTGEAGKFIQAETNAAYVEIAAVYEAHRFTGTMRRLLKLLPITSGGALTAGIQLRSGSPLAWLFDNGSQARHWVSGKSTGKMWGKTPPTHIFARTVGKARRTLAAEFRAMLLRRGGPGTTVTGE